MPGIKQRIALEGAPEITAAFADIAKAGTAAFNALRGASGDIGVDKNVTPQLGRAKKAAEDLGDGFNKLGKAFGSAVQEFANTSAKITAGVTAVGAALFALTKSSSASAAATKEAAVASGQSTQEYQKLAFGFQTAGVEGDKLQRIFGTVSAAVGQAGEQGKSSAGAFAKFNIALRDGGGHARSMTDILSDVADKMAALPNEADRAAFAAELFGRRVGPQLVELLSKGSAGIKALADDAIRLGIVLSDADATTGKKFDESLVRLGGTVEATKTKFGLLFAPAFTEAINGFADAFGQLQPAILGVGQAIANGLAPYITDLAKALTGHADEIKTGFVQVLYDAFAGVSALVRNVVVPAFEGIGTIIKGVGDAVDSVFGQGMAQKIISGAAGAGALVVVFGTVLKSIQLVIAGVRILTGLLGFAGVVTSLSPIGLAIIAIGLAVGLLIVALSQVDWGKFAAWAVEAWNNIKQGAADLVSSMIKGFGEFFDYLKGKIDAALDWFAQLFRAKDQSSKAGSGDTSNAQAPGLAGGGPVFGAGTATSDSINARLSHGEYVHKAAAVSHYGVGFMSAINSMRLPRFALGGLVESLALNIPTPARFAGGGPVLAGSTVNLNLDGNRFSMRASEPTASSLKHYAIGRQTSSAGRRPSWYK